MWPMKDVENSEFKTGTLLSISAAFHGEVIVLKIVEPLQTIDNASTYHPEKGEQEVVRASVCIVARINGLAMWTNNKAGLATWQPS